jgi:bifunctional N-acetylglucosamine-1-phosphate-uridyltransferase/glucosamine-1-phosphate-acetyltransferase GlmU-like protein
MGGGFGGNVLALTKEENVPALIERVQEGYYEPQNRQGVSEGSVMISTPGDGLAMIDVQSVWREVIEEFNASDQSVTTPSGLSRRRDNRVRVNALLDSLTVDRLAVDKTLDAVWPVIVAAGKGTRMRATGLRIPKPLAAVLGTPSIIHVLHNVRTAFGTTRPPIVIVSPETEAKIRESLAGEEVIFVVQSEALGTGDAVLNARREMLGFPGRALIIWSTQPVVRPETMRRTLKLATLFQDYEMVLPTVHLDRPYAPLLRDERGRVRGARETHLEQAERPGFGESNIGMFLVKSESMFNALGELYRIQWNEVERSYRCHGGELGFPNEMINYFATQNAGVLACPIADSREEQGIKRFEDVARCEQFISELAQEKS